VLKIEVHAYVTKEEAPNDEIARLDLEVMTSPTEACFSDYHIIEVKSLEAKTSVASVCSITSRDNSLWQATIVASALLGYLIFMAILNRFSVYPSDHNSYSVYPWRGRVLLTILSMTVGIVIFGGTVYAIWNRRETKNNKVYKSKEEMSIGMQTSESVRLQTLLRWCSYIHYGERPKFQGVSSISYTFALHLVYCKHLELAIITTELYE
ncbi:hypothetical protein KI387_033852, partial [Taxus chinensis]